MFQSLTRDVCPECQWKPSGVFTHSFVAEDMPLGELVGFTTRVIAKSAPSLRARAAAAAASGEPRARALNRLRLQHLRSFH